MIPLRLFAFNDAGDSDPSAPVKYVPIPTPPPSGCPFTDYLTFTNDTILTANRLILPNPYGYQTMTMSENADGCPEPIVRLSGYQYFWEVLWQLPCVDPGESVDLVGTGTGPSVYLTGQWSLAEPTPTPPPTTPTPTVTFTPTPTLTLSPTPTLTQTRTETLAALPTKTPSVTPASLPVAGSSTDRGQNTALLLAAGAALLGVATLAFKRIR